MILGWRVELKMFYVNYLSFKKSEKLFVIYLQLEGNLFEISWDLYLLGTCTSLDQSPRLHVYASTNFDDHYALEWYEDFVW